MLLVCRNLQPIKNLGDLMSFFTWDKLAEGWTCTGMSWAGVVGPVGLGLLQLQAQKRPMSFQEQVPITLAYRQVCPGHALCTCATQPNSAAPSTCECSIGCGMLIPSHLPLNIVFHK